MRAPEIPGSAGVPPASRRLRHPSAGDSKMIKMMRATHPGESILRDCLEPLGLSATDGAKALGVSRKRLSSVINGRAGVSPEMAVRLDKEFGGGAAIWRKLQTAYDAQRDGQDA